MEYRFYIIDLFYIYGELLTSKQQDYFEDYYFNNLTLAEMSENYNVSRNAVHKQIKEAEEKLIKFEEILQIADKNKRIKQFCEILDEEIKNKIFDIL